MKKRFYILSLLAVMFGVVGCHKLDIKPNHDCGEEWRMDDNSEKAGKDQDSEDDLSRGDDEEGITDPNHDEDEDQKRR